jgi:hypothetical protein
LGLPGAVQADFRRQLIGIHNVGVVAFLMRLPGCPHTFMTLINHWSDAYKSPLRYWASQRVLTVFFYEGKELPTYGHQWSADFPSFWASVLTEVEKMPIWSEADFNAAIATPGLTPESVWAST